MEKNLNPQDKVTLDIPLFIRLLEYAKEDAKTDMDLHKVAENILKLSTSGKTLDMGSYDEIVKKEKQEQIKEWARLQVLAGIKSVK